MKKIYLNLLPVLILGTAFIPHLVVAQRIAAGFNHSLAVCFDSTGQAWGSNFSGQIGDGTAGTDAWTPVMISSTDSLLTLSGGDSHSYALKSNGTVWAWGSNFAGQLGDSTNTDHYAPVPINGFADIVAIACGGYHSLALKDDSTVWGTGQNVYGQLGNGTGLGSNYPVIADIIQVTAIGAGYSHSLYIKNNDSVFSSGKNDFGQLGDSTFTDRLSAVPIKTLSGFIAVSGGYAHSLALKSDSTVWGWGHNLYGQCGDGSTGILNYPVQATGLTGVIAIAAGGFHSLALKSDGTVWSWGNNGDGGLGVGFSSPIPVLVGTLSGITAIAAGFLHSMMLKSDGTLWACGDNGNGQCGDGTPTDRTFPVLVSTVCMAVPLLVNLKSFAGNTNNCLTTLDWEVGNEKDCEKYIVQRSGDGISFTDMGSLAALGGDRKYEFKLQEHQDISYYRLKMIFHDQEINYSALVKLNNNCVQQEQLSCFPNPANAHTNIHFYQTQSGLVQFSIFDLSGKKILEAGKYCSSGSQTAQINTSTIAKGVYFLEVNDEYSTRFLKLLKE